MKDLDEFNKDRWEQHSKLNNNSPRLNNIACPECGKEMYDSTPLFVLTSSPPQKNVHCNCGYKGYRLA